MFRNPGGFHHQSLAKKDKNARSETGALRVLNDMPRDLSGTRIAANSGIPRNNRREDAVGIPC
jgi:hypothetical protein